MLTPDAFDTFDENLKLDPDERAEAIKTHNEITDLLRDAGLIVGAFLQGSFARKTMISPLRDIDKVVILHPSLRTLDPDQVMDRLQRVLAPLYPNARFTRSRHALQMDFGPDTFSFDIVPAWETDTDDDDVLIANRDTGGWERSNTRQLIRVIAERNNRTGGRWVHQVRMGKQVIKHRLDGVIPGLHVESWAYMVIKERLDHDEALARILEAGARLVGGTYTDPTGKDQISERLKPEALAAKGALQEIARRAREARRLTDAGDHNEAIRIWHDLCGEPFPEPKAQTTTDALAGAFHGGSVTSSGTVTSARTSPQVARPGRSWRRG